MATVVHVVVSQQQSWLAIAGEIGALIAAGAALVTVWFARATIGEARSTSEKLEGLSQAASATLWEQQTMTEALQLAHKEEMAERERALDAELVIQRLAQVERLSELLRALIDAAREEAVNEPPRLGRQMRATRIPTILLRIETAVASLARLGGPEIPETQQLRTAYRGQNTVLGVIREGTAVLSRIEGFAKSHPSLRLPDAGTAADG